MKRKFCAFLLILILLTGLAEAKLIIQVKERRAEVGSSQSVILQYQNNTSAPVTLSELNVSLVYDPDLIDDIFSVKGSDADLGLAEAEYFNKGSINLKFASKTRKSQVPVGATIDLASISFHLNQLAKRTNYSTRYFSLAPMAGDSGLAVAAPGASPPDQLLIADVYIEGSQPPVFKGIIKISSVNQPGGVVIQNIEWNPATDRTPPVYYDLYRRQSRTERWQLLASRLQQDTFQDPGASHGIFYEYGIAAIDSTTPRPNRTEVLPFEYVPIDVSAPEEVKGLKAALLDDDRIKLTWQNPLEPDLAGVLIMSNYDSEIGRGNLEGARASYPYGDGREYQQWEEPFGSGKGYVRYVSYPQMDPGSVPEEYIDDYTAPGVTFNYRVYTYDLSTAYKMGRNYSKNGVDASISVPMTATKDESVPAITIWFDNKLYKTSEGKEFFVTAKPRIKAEVKIDNPDEYDYSFMVDNARTHKFTDVHTDADRAVMETALRDKLGEGKHTFSVQVAKKLRAAAVGAPIVKNATVTVSGGPLQIVDLPLAFPSPWDPEEGPVTIQFSLNKDGDTELIIFGLTAEIQQRMFCRSGEEGGRAGLNKVVWDGRTLRGKNVAQGIYWVNIRDRDAGNPLGKLKLTVYRGSMVP